MCCQDANVCLRVTLTCVRVHLIQNRDGERRRIVLVKCVLDIDAHENAPLVVIRVQNQPTVRVVEHSECLLPI